MLRSREDVRLGLVGKAITFDAGGISIKPSAGMQDMKGDMSGGAGTLHGIGALAALGTPVRTIAVLAAAENLPGGDAFRPGDVLDGGRLLRGWSGLGTMAVRATWRMTSPFSVSGWGAASLAGPMRALSPFPNADALAIPDFDECFCGGKLIRRDMAHVPAIAPERQGRRRVPPSAGRNYGSAKGCAQAGKTFTSVAKT